MRPLFIHMHVPKSGGTSLNQLLSQWFSGRMEWVYFDDPLRIVTREELEALVAKKQHLDCITSHHFRFFPPVIAGRPALYITFLREPVDYFISAARHLIRDRAQLTAEHRALQPSSLDGLDAVGLMNHWIDDAMKVADWHPFFGADISRLFFRDMIKRMGFDPEKPSRSKADQAWTQCLAKAIAITQLSQFFFLGDFAAFPNEIRRLAEMLRPFGVATGELNIPWERRSAGPVFASVEQERDVRARIEATLSVDCEVYHHFFR